MSNMKLIIIGGVLVFLLVVFGRNPVEERRKEKAESMKGKDMLVESIKEHNSKRRVPKAGSNSGGLLNRPGTGTGGAPARQRSSTQYPSYLMKSDAPAAANPYGQNPFAKQPAAPQATAPQTNSYYPPPPLPEQNNKQQRYTPQYVPGPGSDLGIKLRSGQPVMFSGPEVFTVDATGKTVRLPDGKYPIADGRIILRVKNGRKIAVND